MKRFKNGLQHYIKTTDNSMRMPSDTNSIANQNPPRNRNDVLRNTAILNNIQKHLPKDASTLLHEFRFLGLISFRNRPMAGYSRKIKMAFERRSYMYEQIEKRSRALVNRSQLSYENNMNRAAVIMDSERDSMGMSLPEYIQRLKKDDSNVRKRKRSLSYDYGFDFLINVLSH